MSEFDGVFKLVEDRLTKSVEQVTKSKIKDINQVANDRIEEIANILQAGAKLTIKSGKKQKTIEGLKHKQLPSLIQAVGQRLPVLLVGMAGTGKTHAAEQSAEALGLKFYAMSVGAQTSKSDIIGYMNATGSYVPTLFRRAYEQGGVFLMDEIDAGNANVLIQVNAALSQNYAAFPDKMVKRHKDFAFVATANTFGNGANRMYVGRNQLDAATLDRFTILNWEVDEKLEALIVKPYEHGDRWHGCIVKVRDYVIKNQIRALVTPRATMRGTILLDCGYDLHSTIDAALLNAMPSDKQSEIKRIIETEWNKKPLQSNEERNMKLVSAVEAEVVEELSDIPF